MRPPRRGEVWLADLGLAAKIRPCLVLGVPSTDDDRALVTAVPHTTSLRGTQYEVSVPVRFLRPGAFDAQGIVTLPTLRLVKQLGNLSTEQLQTVVRGVSMARDRKRVLTNIYGLPGFARAFSHLKTRNRLQQYIRPVSAPLALAPMTFARQVPIR